MSKLFPRSEEWIELPSDPTYFISTHGRLYDTIKKDFVRATHRDGEIHKSKYAGDHLAWSVRSLTRSGANRYVNVARAVLQAFVGDGFVPLYHDGDFRNVKLSNLEWAKPGKSLEELASVG